MRLTRSQNDVESRSHTAMGSDVEDQPFSRVSWSPSRCSSEDLGRYRRDDKMSSRRRTREDESNRAVNGTQFRSDMIL